MNPEAERRISFRKSDDIDKKHQEGRSYRECESEKVERSDFDTTSLTLLMAIANPIQSSEEGELEARAQFQTGEIGEEDGTKAATYRNNV